MIAIIPCGSNIASIQFALERLGKTSKLTFDPTIIQSASHVILPGVGHAEHAMQQLKKNNLIDIIIDLKQPVLGICLGMQLLFEYSMEGRTKCLGIIPGKIKHLPKKIGLVMPHIGWNQLHITKNSMPIHNINNDKFVYFVHSYYASPNSHTIATAAHGVKFAAMVQYKNFLGMQFHPEKSGKIGQILLQKFLTAYGANDDLISSN